MIKKMLKVMNILNELNSWENPHKYMIIECFLKDKQNKYELYNLKIDSIQDGIVLFDDGEGILMENMYANTPLSLQAIVIDNILMISHVDNIIAICTCFGNIKIIY